LLDLFVGCHLQIGVQLLVQLAVDLFLSE